MSSTLVFSGVCATLEGQAIEWSKEKGQTTIYKTLHRKLKIE
jgi:hypothetical protein